jgi:hypothetical protein
MQIPIPPTQQPIPVEKMRFKAVPNLPQHDVIYSVAAGKDGKVYMGISSEFGGAVHAHFASYDPLTDQLRDILHLENLIPEGKDRLRPPHAKIHTTMMAHPDGRILWVSHTTPPIEGEKSHRIYEIFGDPERGYLGSFVFSYDPRSDQVQNLGRLYSFCGTRFATLNPERDEIYTVSYPTAHFTVFRLRTGESLDLGRISQNDAIGPCWSANGCAYTTDDDGYLVRYDPQKEILERLPLRIPAPPGHLGNRNRVRRVKAGPDGVKLYGLTGLSCHLYEYDPRLGKHGSLRDIGLLMGEEHFEAPNCVPQGKAMAFGKEGELYLALNVEAAAGGDFPQVHVLHFDPRTGEGEDFGWIEIPGVLPLHTVQDACTDQQGNIYFGTAMPVPPTFLAAFNPGGLAPDIVRLQEQELAQYQMEEAALMEQHQAAARKFKETRRYWISAVMPFVCEGSTLMYDLGLEGFDPPIPPGEAAITALAMGLQSRLYGATSGRCSHLFVHWTATRSVRTFDYPIDLGRLIFDGVPQQSCRALVVGPDGCIYGGTANSSGQSGHLFRHDPSREEPGLIQEFTFYTPAFDLSTGVQIEDLGVPVEGQGILALVTDPFSEQIVGLSSEGALFSFDPFSSATRRLAQLAGHNLSQALLCDTDGSIYGSMGEGKLFQYQDGKLRVLSASLPCGQGRKHLNAASAFTWGPGNKVYGGTTADGMLFSLEFGPSGEVIVTSLGKPTWSGYIRALTTGRDGIIYGIAGRPDVFSRFFSYDTMRHELRDLGILQTSIPRPWVGQRFDAMATGANGEIFLGEADRIAHLFVYYPPVPPAGPDNPRFVD